MSPCIVCRPYMMYTMMRQQKICKHFESLHCCTHLNDRAIIGTTASNRTTTRPTYCTMLQMSTRTLKVPRLPVALLPLRIREFVPVFYSSPQCSHCKRCTSYGNSVCLFVCPSVRLSVCHTPLLCQNDGT